MSEVNPLEIKRSWAKPLGRDFFRRVETTTTFFIVILMSIIIFSKFIIGFSIPLYVLLMSIVFILAFFYPRAGFYSIIILTFIWERFFTLAPIIIDKNYYKIYPLDIILLGIILGIIFSLVVMYEEKRNKFYVLKNKLKKYKKQSIYLLVFILLVTIHFLIDILFLGGNKSLAFSSFKYYTFYPLLYFITLILFQKKKDRIKLFKISFFTGTFLIGFIVYGLFCKGGLWTEYTPMSTSGFRILAFTHSFYLTMVWLGLFVFMIKQRQLSIKYLLLLLILGGGIIGSMMRHLWLGIILSLGILFVFYFQKKEVNFAWKRIKYYLPGIVFVLGMLVYTGVIFPRSNIGSGLHNINKVIYERIVSLGNIQKDDSFSWRELAWKEAGKQYSNNPVYGLGFGNILSLEKIKYHNFVEVRNIHNSWLVLFFQSGPIIFIAFIIFIGSIIKNFIKKRKYKRWDIMAVEIIIINYFFVALFQPYLEANMLAIFFWILLGLATVQNDKTAKSSRDKVDESLLLFRQNVWKKADSTILNLK